MSWFYLALLAPLLYAIVNLLDDNLLRQVYKSAHAGTIVSGLLGIAPAILILLFGLGTESLPANLIGLSLIAGFLTILGIYFYFIALERENPSVVMALFALTPAAIPFAAYFLVGERLSLNEIIGFGIVIIAAFIYSLSDIRKFTISKALVPAISAALVFDVVALANKYVYTKVDFYSAYLYFSLGMFIGGLIFLGWQQFTSKKVSIRALYKKNSTKLLLLLVMVEALGLIAGFVSDRALSLGSVSLVMALGNLQPLYILLISVLLFPFFPKYFREAKAGNIKLKFALSALMILGVYIAVK